MQSKQRQPATQRRTVPPVPSTIFHQLPTSNQQQLAHLVADLIQRARRAAKDQEHDHER